MPKPSNINNMLPANGQSVCIRKNDWVNVMEDDHRLNGVVIEVRKKMIAIKINDQLTLLTEKGRLSQPMPFKKKSADPNTYNLWKLII